MVRLSKTQDFDALSIKDLLEARDAYHVHLSSLRNVEGTAIGKYLIRKVDPDAVSAGRPNVKASPAIRTLTNSVVQPWSWPCVLVFVSRWARPEEFAESHEEYVPPRLYLPDGRVVPTCVVYAVRDPDKPQPLYDLDFSDGLLGGGYPVLSSVQGEDRIGSLGCLVSDGHTLFALTNRHVAGPAGQVAYTVTGGSRRRIGESHGLALGKLDFDKAYPGWSGFRTQVNLDAGLVRIDNLAVWTAQVYGIGEVGKLVDANVDKLSLEVIGKPVCAFGAASGSMQGAIKALFYRYHSQGGFDYVADFLIGPREGDASIPTRHGDSGTIWFWDENPEGEGKVQEKKEPEQESPRRFQPLAMQWGGQILEGPGGQERSQFALTSSLATICRVLDLELVTDLNIGNNPYWGKVGHYKLGAKACDVVANEKLYRLMQANIDRVAVTDGDIANNDLPMSSDSFVALADVSDLVWRSRRGKEGPAHFANVDQEGAGEFAGRTLLDLWRADPAMRNPETWVRFYDGLGIHYTDQGYLPFRVREIYEEMVSAVRARNLARYVAAAGILSHYVADACQPLHISWLHHGRPGHPEEEDVHRVYETSMLERYRVELVDGINDELDGLEIAGRFRGGAAAADAAVDLMETTLSILDPLAIIEAFHAGEGQQRTARMWEALRERTVECMVQGILYLAEMWESAWYEGGGNAIGMKHMKAQSQAAIRRLYLDNDWMESTWLRDKQF